MKNTCKNHPERSAISICHNCGDYYCKDCLNEGKEYYYCNNKVCNDRFLEEPKPFSYDPSEDVAIPKIKKWGWGWTLLLGLIFYAIAYEYNSMGNSMGLLYLIGVCTSIPIYFYFRNKILKVKTSPIYHSFKAGLISYLITALIVAILASLIKRI